MREKNVSGGKLKNGRIVSSDVCSTGNDIFLFFLVKEMTFK